MMKLNPFKNAIGEGDKNRFMAENENTKKYLEFYYDHYFKKLSKKERTKIIFLIRFPRENYLLIGLFFSLLAFVLSLFIRNYLILFVLLILIFALIYRIRSKSLSTFSLFHDYYYNLLKSLT